MPNPVFALQEERNWLEVIITEHNNFCCGICIAAIEEKLAREGLIRVGGSFHVNSYYSQGNTENKYLSTMNPILKGKILELIIQKLQVVDPFNEVNARDYSHFLHYLERFFSREYMSKVLKGSYMGVILTAWQKKEAIHQLEIKNVLDEQKNRKRIRGLIKDWEQDKRIKQKRGRDLGRASFLNRFKELSPIKKLELILNDETEFPYQCIPDEFLFKVNLITRYQIQKRFNSVELNILKVKFGSEKRKNKRKGWVRILKGL